MSINFINSYSTMFCFLFSIYFSIHTNNITIQFDDNFQLFQRCFIFRFCLFIYAYHSHQKNNFFVEFRNECDDKLDKHALSSQWISFSWQWHVWIHRSFSFIISIFFIFSFQFLYRFFDIHYSFFFEFKDFQISDSIDDVTFHQFLIFFYNIVSETQLLRLDFCCYLSHFKLAL